VPGRLLEVREVRTLDGVVVVEDEDGDAHALGESLARSIFVQQAPERRTAKTTN
jgi:DtxR family transcriptional regulator, Mn-dependent transcriptional regulator